MTKAKPKPEVERNLEQLKQVRDADAAVLEAILESAPKKVRDAVNQMDHAGMSAKGLLLAGSALFIMLVADADTEVEQKVRLGCNLLAEQRKTLEKFNLSESEPLKITLGAVPDLESFETDLDLSM